MLPAFTVVKLPGKPGQIGIVCPRADCGGKAIVAKRKWMTQIDSPTRPCPYCFRAARLPE